MARSMFAHMIRCGASRYAIMLPSVVLKCPRWDNWREGVASNLRERRIWSRERLSLLCPVIMSSRHGWWLLMPRARSLTDNEWAELEGQLYASVVTDDDPYFGIPVELKRDNFGILQGQPVAVDYGGPS
jgi:hypothetical protein